MGVEDGIGGRTGVLRSVVGPNQVRAVRRGSGPVSTTGSSGFPPFRRGRDAHRLTGTQVNGVDGDGGGHIASHLFKFSDHWSKFLDNS
jgi:hypothetical protein